MPCGTIPLAETAYKSAKGERPFRPCCVRKTEAEKCREIERDSCERGRVSVRNGEGVCFACFAANREGKKEMEKEPRASFCLLLVFGEETRERWKKTENE